MRLAELGSSAYLYLDNDSGISLGYSDIAGGGDGEGKFAVRVISDIAKLGRARVRSNATS